MNKAIFERRALLTALKRGGVNATANGTLPILENVRLTTNGEGFDITSSNISTEITCFCKAEEMPDDNIDVCVNAKTLTDIMQNVNDYNITLDFEENMLAVRYGAGVMNLPTVPSDEFPSMSKTEEPQCVFELNNENLRYIVNGASAFTGKDELRPAMTSIYISVGNGTLEYCATDAHRLISERIQAGDFSQDMVEMLIPSMSVKPILNTIQDEGSCVVRKYENSVSVQTDNCKLTTVLTEGKFPNFRAIIPSKESVTKVYRIRRDDITNAIKRMTMMSNMQTNTIVLDFNGGNLTVKAEDLDYGKSGSESVTSENVLGEPITIGFNGSFLSACISEVQSEYVRINMTEANRAMVISDEGRPEKTVLLMPVTINA